MNQHNIDILETIENYKTQLKIDNLINEELDKRLPLDVHQKMYNLYSVLDIKDLLRSK